MNDAATPTAGPGDDDDQAENDRRDERWTDDPGAALRQAPDWTPDPAPDNHTSEAPWTDDPGAFEEEP